MFLATGLGKANDMGCVQALWEKCCLSKPLSLATSCLSAELVPFFLLDPQMLMSASQSPARTAGPAKISPGPLLASVLRASWGPSARQVGTLLSWISGKLDCGHQDTARASTMPGGWSLSWTP